MLFQLNWRRYLNVIVFLSAVGFLASGAITWVAANWADFSKIEKLVLAQITLIISIMVVLIVLCFEDNGSNIGMLVAGGLFAFYYYLFQQI